MPDLRIAQALDALGLSGPEEVRPVSGGDISAACAVTLRDGRKVFVKTNDAVPPDFFAAEADGLHALASAGALRVPEVLGVGRDSIVLEWIDAGQRGPNFWETFGRAFADLHRRTLHDRFGFDRDGYIGRTPQENAWTEDGTAFWRDRRLGFQLDLARKNGLASPEMNRLGDRLLARLEVLLLDERPCLLHGDLWSGNFLAGPSGEPVLIDPAAFYGHREADLAMTHLFGGFDAGFYAAYEEAYPLAPGAGERRDLFALYPLLNHLNLFGRSYEGAVMGVLRKYA